MIGMNSRLDTIQAAILIEKLKIFDDEIEKRNAVARRYNDAFAGSNRIKTPVVIEGAVSTWAQYTLQVADRAKFQAGLKDKGVPTAVYYPIPLSRQRAYAAYPSAPDARQRGPERPCGEPADASLSGAGHPGPHHCRGSRKRGIKFLLPRRPVAGYRLRHWYRSTGSP